MWESGVVMRAPLAGAVRCGKRGALAGSGQALWQAQPFDRLILRQAQDEGRRGNRRSYWLYFKH
ncbi:hypothetical protein MAXJ12_02246 [Mesorhizobium alhagi CCNWXJ12-2]|uniref:Uncharacterized protein n=1 Tax=Mesorhizobium alhagi CCNWXJ12-2 TaxID=1107882 RepID=H0HJZ4_9HYPH|nr:hypothetical protein MAXJ12_02246 [Mesorhizobium alhagi CCNWXJ12-2]